MRLRGRVWKNEQKAKGSRVRSPALANFKKNYRKIQKGLKVFLAK
jgi:hypothetical protein